MCTTLVLVLALALGCAALSPIAFRLDDVQCGYMQGNAMAIMDAFLRNNVPLTIGLITAPPLNWQENFDCHVPDILTRKANFASAGVGFEFASHSVTHELMTTMTPEQQWYQLNTSKVHIETKFNTQVTTFLPPQNQWNADMVALGVTAGYKIWSGQCGAGQMNGASADGACIVNMRRDISPSFFGAIDSMIHAPVGATVASTTGQYLTVDQIMASTTTCESTYCSINSQMQGNIARTQGGASWGIVMMHPQEFPNTTVIDTFFDDLLTRVKAVYTPYTIRDLVTAVSGTTFPSSTGGSGQTSSSTGSASSSSSTGTITDGSSSSGSASSSSSTGVAMDSSSSGSSLSNSTSALSSSAGLGLTNGSSSTGRSSSSSSSTGSISSAYSTSSISFALIVMASFSAISMVTSML